MSNDDNYNPMSMNATMARIEERQKMNCAKLDNLIEIFGQVEKRLQDLERWKYWLLGVAAVVAALVSTVKHLILKL